MSSEISKLDPEGLGEERNINDNNSADPYDLAQI
jgi:hypothetical protein